MNATSQLSDNTSTPVSSSSVSTGERIKFGRTVWENDEQETEVFTMSVGDETISLIPFRIWSQLDHHKWVSRGKLPGSPPGFEVTDEHVKIAGDIVSISDAGGCAKLEAALLAWLELERNAAEEARKKAQSKPVAAMAQEAAHGPEPMHYVVDMDKAGQVHIRCVQGKETLTSIGLSAAGFKSLYSQGLMRKPHALQVGALHDWIEIDGVMYSFEKGRNDAGLLERALNENYLPKEALGQGKDIVIFANPASSTGFDIQFPVMMGGVRDTRRRPLNEDTLALLQDPVRCGLLRKEIVIKVTRPTFVFKQKTPDGGERYLDSTEDNLVRVADEDGNEKVIDLSHPVNYLHLSTGELTAVLNHPAIHKHSKAPARSPNAAPPPPPRSVAGPASAPVIAIPAQARPAAPTPAIQAPEPKAPTAPLPVPAPQPPAAPPSLPPVHRLNEWLREGLSHKSIRHEWFAFVVYTEMARLIGNSTPGKLGFSNCFACSFGEVDDIADERFQGLFLTEKGGFGYLNQGHIARFNKGVAFLGTQENALEGINVSLLGAGFDVECRVVFIVTDNFKGNFGVSAQQVAQELARLREHGVLILSATEVLEGPDVMEVIWTVPIEQVDAENIKATEFRRPEVAEPGNNSQG